MRLAHTAFGGLAAIAWLLLPTTTEPAESRPTPPHPAARPVARVATETGGRAAIPVGPAGSAAPPVPSAPQAVGTGSLVASDGEAAPGDGESSGVDLILPVAAAGAAVAVAAYSLVRRRRRARLRTTPTGAFAPPTTPLPDLHHRAERLLVETDDSIRTSMEELHFAAAGPGHATVPLGDGPSNPTEPPEAGPTAAQGTPEPPPKEPEPADATEPPTADAEPPTSAPTDPTEAPPGGTAGPHPRQAVGVSPYGPLLLDPAKPFAETPAARDAVQPFVEALADARGELGAAFSAGLRLDEGRGALSADEERALLEEILTRCTTAQRRLDTATPAFDQLRALERDITPALEHAETRFRELTGRTATAASTLTALRDTYAPAVSLPVTGHVEQAKDRLVFATTELNRARQAAYPGDLGTAAVHLRAAEGAIDQADLFVTGVERLATELARATTERGTPPTGPYDDPGDPRDARGAVLTAADFVTTHRAAVGAQARTRLSEAERHLAHDHTERAHALAQEARKLAEQDVRAYGNPYGGPVGDGLAGALLGGIILGEPPDGTGRADLRGPACFGGTATRARRTAGGQF
ncbi:hypothetical protein F9278_32575 [Streptomyces phaeolivaceus]|uniref:TPM domain-containing protein n=1 Tax=Streptomyces phaeolivaceus TaxID=2653200 RepID=A0A5P8KC49_9ACTN|nr:hypothetical protein [Streptomyces phaeolivaceus]QFR00110.1 hypothetical protein F9278_32575 [Streptomyces phaeolivaceus]